jgi:hypothetical protein
MKMTFLHLRSRCVTLWRAVDIGRKRGKFWQGDGSVLARCGNLLATFGKFWQLLARWWQAPNRFWLSRLRDPASFWSRFGNGFDAGQAFPLL